MNGAPNSIVILEDDTGMCRAIERLLRLSGFVTCSFQSAEEAGAYDCALGALCLVIDVQLPGASGPTFYEALQAPRPPAVFITAYDAPATRQAVAMAGQHTLLTKPFLGAALLDAVGTAIRNKS